MIQRRTFATVRGWRDVLERAFRNSERDEEREMRWIVQMGISRIFRELWEFGRGEGEERWIEGGRLMLNLGKLPHIREQ